MMDAQAYYNGSKYITEEKVPVKPNKKVIITLLDDFVPKSKKTLEEILERTNVENLF